jgi:CubicO group peptidase (beta-lactamase class C family)
VFGISLAGLLGTHPADARQAREAWPEVDAVFAEFQRPGSPGCAVGVFKDGRVLYERGYGLASVEHDVPITPDTAFYAGSVSKQFTAFAAALAIADGKLSTKDSIRKWLPELPPYADAIRVEHLVHHTSGLRDYNTLLSIAGRRGDEAYDNPTVLRMTARQKALNFAPGAEYLYSNTGYTLLATIVERATKSRFAEYAEERIFRPLGMTVTHFHTDVGRLVKWRALAYSGAGEATRLDTPVNQRAGAGGLYTSVRDLLPWEENFYTGKVGGPAVVRQVQTPGALAGGQPLTYAWGLTVGSYRGLRTVEHSGSLGGYRTFTLRFPEQHTSVVALCNLASANPTARSRRVADVVLKDVFTNAAPASAPAAEGQSQPSQPAGKAAPAPTKTDDPQTLAGTYVSDEIDATFTVLVKEGALMLQRDTDDEPVPLQRMPSGEYRARGFSLRFDTSSTPARSFTVDAGRVRDIRFHRKPS